MWFFSSVNSLTLNELCFPESLHIYCICRVPVAYEGARMLAEASTDRAFSKMNVSVFRRLGAPAKIACICNARSLSNTNTVILNKFWLLRFGRIYFGVFSLLKDTDRIAPYPHLHPIHGMGSLMVLWDVSLVTSLSMLGGQLVLW